MPTTASGPILYRYLGIGLTLIAVVFLVGRMFQPAPVRDDSTVPFALAGVSLAMLAFAQLVLRPRVPPRGPGQTVEAYWASTPINLQVFRVWFITEGAGIIAGAGYWVTGHAITAAMMAVAVAVYWLTGPNVFAKP